MSRKFDKRLAALEKILNRPLPLKIQLHPRFFADGRPLPPEIIAMYKRGMTHEEWLHQYVSTPVSEQHRYLSPEEQQLYDAR
jgi:hypothetical protein